MNLREEEAKVRKEARGYFIRKCGSYTGMIQMIEWFCVLECENLEFDRKSKEPSLMYVNDLVRNKLYGECLGQGDVSRQLPGHGDNDTYIGQVGSLEVYNGPWKDNVITINPKGSRYTLTFHHEGLCIYDVSLEMR